MDLATPSAETATKDAGLPLVSIIVPVRNEAGFIAGCIEALAAQDYPRECYEVIVLDGGSTDETVSALREAARRADLTVAVLPNPRRKTAAGFNLGLAAARGEVIIKVDGHTRVDTAFISASVRALNESGADAVGGPIRTRGEGALGRAIALAMSSPFGIGNAAFRYSDQEQWTDTVPFGAYRRGVFDVVGELAEDIDRGEDDEFNYRLQAHGLRILLTPRIGSDYYARSDLGGLARQYWGYGLAKAAVLGRHPRRLRPRHLVPSAFVLSLAGGLAFGRIDRRLRRLSALSASAYAVANLLATMRIARRGNAEAAPYLPIAFATIHIAAGTGFIAGLARYVGQRLLKRN